jgi:hypothetical protein
MWLRGRDLNPRPLGYEPNELPDCSTPRQENLIVTPGNHRRKAATTSVGRRDRQLREIQEQLDAGGLVIGM